MIQKPVFKLDVQLRRPRPEKPNIDRLRAALLQRAEQWKSDLRQEPAVARLLMRRLVGPLTLWNEPEGGVRWEAEPRSDELLDGLVQHGTSPTKGIPEWTREVPGEVRAVGGGGKAA